MKTICFFLSVFFFFICPCNLNAKTIDCDLARLYLSKGFKDDRYFKKAIDLCSGYIRPYELYGNELRKKGEKREALKYFETAAELGSRNYKLYYHLANLHYGFQNYDLAIGYLKKSLDLRSDYPKSIKLLELLRQKKDNKGPVIKLYDPIPGKDNRVAYFYKTISVRGIVRDLSEIVSFTVNGTNVTPNPEGEFLHDVALHIRNNEISIKATDIYNNSSLQNITVYRAESIADSKLYKNKFAVIVGINEYQHLPRLHSAVNDATAVKNELSSQGFNQIIEILNSAATRSRILTELYDRLPGLITRDDLLVFYFAGHGMTHTMPNGIEQGFIIPAESRMSDYFQTAISMQQIKGICNHIPAKHIIFIMDCCYSGQIIAQGQVKIKSDNPGNPALDSRRVIEVLTAGGKDQKVLEDDNHGLFTRYLITSLKGAADRNLDNVLSGSELGTFIVQNVDTVSRSQQVPVFSKIQGTGDIFFFLKGSTQ